MTKTEIDAQQLKNLRDHANRWRKAGERIRSANVTHLIPSLDTSQARAIALALGPDPLTLADVKRVVREATS